MTVAAPKKGDQFKSELDGVPVILEIVEVVMISDDKREAMLKTRLVRRLIDGE